MSHAYLGNQLNILRAPSPSMTLHCHGKQEHKAQICGVALAQYFLNSMKFPTERETSNGDNNTDNPVNGQFYAGKGKG